MYLVFTPKLYHNNITLIDITNNQTPGRVAERLIYIYIWCEFFAMQCGA